MSVKQTYAIWNNKGGVGKSTIAFHLATRLAESNPKVKVLVADLCPQANASMMLLGGGTAGEDAVLDLCKSSTPKTVVGYLANVIASGPGAPLPDPFDWIVQATTLNASVSDNLYLLCGDGNLEPMAPLISDRASAPALTPASDPWKWVHLVIKELIAHVSKRDAADWIVFIDTNPSFSIYTEIAVSSATRLIVPVNADDSSRVAINAMFTLLHGSNPPHPIYGKYTFAEKAKARGLDIPAIHLIVGNRLTQHEGPATAFEAMTDATAESLFSAYSAMPSRFSPTDKGPLGTVAKFKKAYSVPLRDFNTAGVVASHLGRPLSRLQTGYYKVHGVDVNVDGRRVSECQQAVDAVLTRL